MITVWLPDPNDSDYEPGAVCERCSGPGHRLDTCKAPEGKARK